MVDIFGHGIFHNHVHGRGSDWHGDVDLSGLCHVFRHAKTMKNSDFRVWVIDYYTQNREERLTYRQEPYTIIEYLSQFKWWLRSRYRKQQKKAQDGRR